MNLQSGHGWDAAFREALEASGAARFLPPQAAAALNHALVSRGARAAPRRLVSARVTCPDCSDELVASRPEVKRDPRADCVVFDLNGPLFMVHVPRWCRRCQQVRGNSNSNASSRLS